MLRCLTPVKNDLSTYPENFSLIQTMNFLHMLRDLFIQSLLIRIISTYYSAFHICYIAPLDNIEFLTDFQK